MTRNRSYLNGMRNPRDGHCRYRCFGAAEKCFHVKHLRDAGSVEFEANGPSPTLPSLQQMADRPKQRVPISIASLTFKTPMPRGAFTSHAF